MALIETGVAAEVLEGQAESGDRHLVKSFIDGVLVAVVDGLGHGAGAASAAGTAVGEPRRTPTRSRLDEVRQ